MICFEFFSSDALCSWTLQLYQTAKAFCPDMASCLVLVMSENQSYFTILLSLSGDEEFYGNGCFHNSANAFPSLFEIVPVSILLKSFTPNSRSFVKRELSTVRCPRVTSHWRNSTAEKLPSGAAAKSKVKAFNGFIGLRRLQAPINA